MNVTIESVIALDATQKKELETVLTEKIPKATFEYLVNEKILGGLRLTAGSKRIDLSLSGRLSQIEKQLESQQRN